MALVTDLNNRERTKYADDLIAYAETATKLAGSLRDGNDSSAVVSLLLLGSINKLISELASVFVEATHVNIPDHVPDRS